MQSVSRTTAVANLENSKRDIAQRLVNRVFDSMRRTNVRDGIVENYSTPDEWRHRTGQDIEIDLAYLEIDRPSILAALSDYLADSTIQNQDIDWLFLNLLTYSEYIATMTEVRKKLLGIDDYIKGLHPPKDTHNPSISALMKKPARTFVEVGIIGFSFLIHPALGLGVGAVCLYWHLKRKAGLTRIDTVLSAMLQTYASFNTVDLSWSHASRSLEQSQLEGAVWDASVFKLVEARQSSSPEKFYRAT